MDGEATEQFDGLLLGVDTCGAESSIALGRLQHGALSIEREILLPARAAGTHLTLAFHQLLEGPQKQELRGIVVVRGPGSFTGMRIGLSAAKALAEALQIPLFGISRLELLASLYAAGVPAIDAVAEASVFSYVALDAGRGRVYVRPAPSLDEATADGLLLSAGELHAMLSPEEHAALLVCEEKMHAQFPGAQRVAPPTAAQALGFALKRVCVADADDPETLDALYLWRPEQMLASPEQAR